ncbi:MAG: IS21-like element helper ATPase IstB [Bacteroidales bacterium]
MMQIESQLSRLRLHGMGRSWQALLETRRQNELTLSEGLELLLQAEEQERNNNRFERLRKNARFRYQASIEELKLDASRGVDKGLIMTLATGEYLSKGEAILVTGATGCGKSFFVSSLGHQACAQGYRVAYYNFQKLLMKTKIARKEGTIYKFFETTSKTDLLIIDDFGLSHLDQQQQMDLMEIIEDRHGKSSTIIASQLPVESWYDVIGEETIADAIMDRLVHTAYRIELRGENLRKNR